MATVHQVAEVTIEDLSDAAAVDLSSYTFTFDGDKDGKALPASKSFTVTTRVGIMQIDCSIDQEHITKPSAGVTVTVVKETGSMSPIVTIAVTSALTRSVLSSNSIVSIPVQFSYQGETVTVTKDFDLAIAPTGATGAAGYNYFLALDADAIVRAEDGTLSITTITARTTRGQVGTPAAWSGWYWVHTTTDGSTWTQIAKSTAAEATKSVSLASVGADVTAIRVSVHTASPTDANRVDVQTVPIIDAGATGPEGKPAYTVVLSNESHGFAATADNKAVASSIETVVRAYKGGTQVAATIGTVTGTISGKLTATVKSGTNSTLNPTLTIAATASLDVRQGMLSIPITVDGKSFTKVFSWSLAPKGNTGDQGPAGEDGLSMSITSSNGTILRNNTGSTTLTAHVWQSGQELTGSALSAIGTIKWYKDGGSTPVATGASITVAASDIVRKGVYAAKLES